MLTISCPLVHSVELAPVALMLDTYAQYKLWLCWPMLIYLRLDYTTELCSTYADHFLSSCSFSRTCSSCLDLDTYLPKALTILPAIYLRLDYTLSYLPKALTILHCSMSLTTLTSIHQYIHTSISNINEKITQQLTLSHATWLITILHATLLNNTLSLTYSLTVHVHCCVALANTF